MYQGYSRLRTTVYTLLLALLHLTLAKQQCDTYPNYNTKAFTYIVCTGTSVTNLESSRQFCQENYESSDVITFPSKDEFDFITEVMNSSLSQTHSKFKYFPGIFQKGDEANRYNPETGEYFWITDPETRLTNESTSYWKPFDFILSRFPDQSLWIRQRATFLLDINGAYYPGQALFNIKSDTDVDGGVVCMKKGVPEKFTASVTSPNVGNGGEQFEYWIVIAAAGGVLVLGVVIGAIAYCVYRKKSKDSDKQKFTKVPQSDNHHNNNTPTNQYEV